MSGTRVLLIQPPIYDFALYDLFLVPFGLMRIGEWLAASGYEVELLDALSGGDGPRRDGPGRGKIHRTRIQAPEPVADVPRRYGRYGMPASDLRERIARAGPDLVLITSGMTYWYQGVEETVRILEETRPDAPVMIGGIYATLLPGHCRTIAPRAAVLPGNAQASLPDALASAGLSPPTGSIPANPGGALVSSARLSQAAVLRLNEGCRGRCSYCASSAITPRFRAGAPDEPAEFVRAFVSRGITHFALYDDALLEDAEASLVPFLEQIIEEHGPRKLSFYLPNAVHASKITPRIACLLRDAGARDIRLGVESLDLGFHRRHDAKLRRGELDEAVRMLRDAGFDRTEVTAYVLAGLPGQAAAAVEETVRGLLDRGVRVSVSEYSPVPGSPLFEEACRASRYPLESEPLCHNNAVFPLAWEGFTPDQLWRIKELARSTR